MTLSPTLKGGLAIEPHKDSDWELLEMIPEDGGRPDRLAESFADLMDKESDWEEFVAPDLTAAFESQCQYVAQAIKHARDNNKKNIIIWPDDAEHWYGAVNQARLALEARYGIKSIGASGDVPEGLYGAFIRDSFYQALQEELLDHVIH